MNKIKKIFFLNIIILLIFFLFIEFCVRVYLVVKNNNTLSFLKNPPSIKIDKYRNILEYSPVLGFVPKKNIQLKVDLEYWDNSILTINELGFRKGIENNINMNDPILIAGDSFVFGNQVNDFETWPAFLQKKDYNIFNLGVGGFGTAQSLLRIKKFIKNNSINPKIVMLQTLVGYDFKRDRLDFYSGFPSISLYQNKDGNIDYYCPELSSIDIFGSKFSSQNTDRKIYITLSEYSYFIRMFFQDEIQNYQKRLTRVYKKAISKTKIIDYVLKEFSQLPYKKIFILQYGGDNNKEVIEERKYLIRKLKELSIPYIDTYNATRINGVPLKKLYYYHHTPEGNKVIADYIINTKLLD